MASCFRWKHVQRAENLSFRYTSEHASPRESHRLKGLSLLAFPGLIALDHWMVRLTDPELVTW